MSEIYFTKYIKISRTIPSKTYWCHNGQLFVSISLWHPSYIIKCNSEKTWDWHNHTYEGQSTLFKFEDSPYTICLGEANFSRRNVWTKWDYTKLVSRLKESDLLTKKIEIEAQTEGKFERKWLTNKSLLTAMWIGRFI